VDGNRKTNQDSFLVELPKADAPSMLVGVFDGHGEHGHVVSRQCKAQFGKLFSAARQQRPDLAGAITATFLEQDHACTVAIDCSQSGTTAVACFLDHDKDSGAVHITTAWTGDSRAVLTTSKGDGQMQVTDLSIDQKPERPDEKARIERCGGVVQPVFDEFGPSRDPNRYTRHDAATRHKRRPIHALRRFGCIAHVTRPLRW
jgi:serine/threonine protein phosphatase PrpC